MDAVQRRRLRGSARAALAAAAGGGQGSIRRHGAARRTDQTANATSPRSPRSEQSTILPITVQTTAREAPVLHHWTRLIGVAMSALVGLCIAAPAVAQIPAWAPADLLAAATAEGGTMT